MDLLQVIGKVMNVAGQQEIRSLSDVVNGLDYTSGHWRWDGIKVEPEAMSQLVQQRLGGIPGILNDESLRPAFKLDYLRQKASALTPHNITVRFNDKVRGFVSEQMAETSNTGIVTTLGELYQQQELPKDVEAHRFFLSKDGTELFMRLISKTWNFGPYFGGLAISNEELKSGMKVRPGVAKVSCFNWCLRETIYKPEDREAISNVLMSGLTMVSTFAKEGIARMEQMGSIEVNKINSLFDLVAQEMKLPDNVKSEMYKYWVQQGSGRSIFDVVQAVTWGTQALTDNTGRRRPRWSERDNLEEAIWGWSQEVMDEYASGANLDEMVANKELVRKSQVIAALREQEDPLGYVRSLPPVAFSK